MAKKRHAPTAKQKAKGASKDKKKSGKLLGSPEELLFLGAPPAIKVLYKTNTGYDKDVHPLEYLTQLRKGHSPDEIATSFGISVHTLNQWCQDFAEMAEARKVGATAYVGYWKYTTRLAAFGQIKGLKENILFKILDNQVGYGQDGGGHEFADTQGAEVVFIDADGKPL
jgi:hypothetical protein